MKKEHALTMHDLTFRSRRVTLSNKKVIYQKCLAARQKIKKVVALDTIKKSLENPLKGICL